MHVVKFRKEEGKEKYTKKPDFNIHTSGKLIDL